MSLTGDLRTYILADPTVSGLIGTRFYDLFVPEDETKPYCSFFREMMEIEDHLTDKTTLRMSKYSLSIVADNSVQGEAVEEALIEILASTRGTIGTSDVRVIYYNGSSDSFIPPVDGSEESVHIIELNFEVHWKTT